MLNMYILNIYFQEKRILIDISKNFKNLKKWRALNYIYQSIALSKKR